nr:MULTISPECIES: PAS domain-containing protein [unclassified Nannocystis]
MDFLSAGAHELTGYSVHEVVDARAVSYGVDMIVAEDQAHAWEVVQAGLTAHSKWEVEYRIRRRDGQVRWVWEQGHGVFAADGSLEFLVGYILEIEDRKRAEALLSDRESELARKNAELEAVSIPVLEVADHTLVVPLIGELTATRDARLLNLHRRATPRRPRARRAGRVARRAADRRLAQGRPRAATGVARCTYRCGATASRRLTPDAGRGPGRWRYSVESSAG